MMLEQLTAGYRELHDVMAIAWVFPCPRRTADNMPTFHSGARTGSIPFLLFVVSFTEIRDIGLVFLLVIIQNRRIPRTVKA
jgi:hypothetical protein